MSVLKIRLGLAALMAVCALGAVPSGAAAQGGAKAVVEKALSRINPNGPGASVAVIAHGRVSYEGGRGLADVAHHTAITPTTVFDLASCSKQFTAMATMIAAKKGLLSLNDNIRRFVPEIPVYDASRPIKVEDLLHMTSGLPIYTDFMDDLDGVHNVDVARQVGKRKLMFHTGTKHAYNNTDYALLALIVERASKKPFATFVRENIFRPLGMNQSMVLDDPHKHVPGRAQGYTPKGRSFKAVREDTYVVGDGQVFTSLDDMIKWDRGLHQYTLTGADLGKKAYVSGRLSNGKATGYGYGWFVGENDGKPYVNHEGEWTGTNTYISRDLGEDVSVIVLSNNDQIDAGTLGQKIENGLE